MSIDSCENSRTSKPFSGVLSNMAAKFCLFLALGVSLGTFVEREMPLALVNFFGSTPRVSSNIKCGAMCQAEQRCDVYHYQRLERNCTLGEIADLALTSKTTENTALSLKFHLTRSVGNGESAKNVEICPSTHDLDT